MGVGGGEVGVGGLGGGVRRVYRGGGGVMQIKFPLVSKLSPSVSMGPAGSSLDGALALLSAWSEMDRVCVSECVCVCVYVCDTHTTHAHTLTHTHTDTNTHILTH